MKKSFFLFIMLVMVYLPLISFAQNDTANEEIIVQNTGGTTVNVKIPEYWLLNNLIVKFVDKGGKEIGHQIDLPIRPWQSKYVYVKFINTSEIKSIAINSSIVDAIIDNRWKVKCSSDANTGYFPSLLSYNTGDLVFILSPQEQVVKRLRITAPNDMSGYVYGCVGYQLDKKRTPEDGMFLILRRKVILIKANITWSVYNFWRRDDIKYAYTDNKEIILKILIGILSVRLLVTIIKTVKKPEHHNKKK